MVVLPAIENYVINRPGKNAPIGHFIINPVAEQFWCHFFNSFKDYIKLTPPIENFHNKINPYFGYFGYRWHPINYQPRYFHIGIDIGADIGTTIQTVAPGLLDYSGFANINGNYLAIKHPEIFTADGFVLHSLYMHCKDIFLRFSLPQKILREYFTTKSKYSNINICSMQNIGTVGNTGNELGVVPHLHLQFEFIKNGKHVAINPLSLYGKDTPNNLTSELTDKSDFSSFYINHKVELKPWSKFWRDKII